MTSIPNKPKDLLTRVKFNSSHYEIYFENGGEVPKELSGEYNSQLEANRAIKRYLVSKNRYGTTSNK